MPGGGTRTFLEPDHYEASLREAQIEAVIISQGKFNARLTRAELQSFDVLRCEEDFPRVGFVHLAPSLAFVTCPTPPTQWRGSELQTGDIMFHSPGERLHQSTSGSFVWNVIAIDPAQLEHYGRALTAKRLVPPQNGQVLRPLRRDVARLRRLHAQVCRLAETNSKMLSHPEVARAIEQELIHALVTCLTTTGTRPDNIAARRNAGIMMRFEEILAEHLTQHPTMQKLCELIGVSDRKLRSCCAEFLGMSPTRYVLLRRLKNVRSALREASPKTGNVAGIAHRFGFAQLGRFAGTYRATFGETPSTTLRRPAAARFAAE